MARSDEPGTRVRVAGLITRRGLERQEVASFDSKLTAGAFGTFVPLAPAVAVPVHAMRRAVKVTP